MSTKNELNLGTKRTKLVGSMIMIALYHSNCNCLECKMRQNFSSRRFHMTHVDNYFKCVRYLKKIFFKDLWHTLHIETQQVEIQSGNVTKAKFAQIWKQKMLTQMTIFNLSLPDSFLRLRAVLSVRLTSWGRDKSLFIFCFACQFNNTLALIFKRLAISSNLW